MTPQEMLKAIDELINYQPPFFTATPRMDALYYRLVSPAVYQACMLPDKISFDSSRQPKLKAQLPFGIMRLQQRGEARKGVDHGVL